MSRSRRPDARMFVNTGPSPMLRSTLLHLPGIGPVREKRLWAEGVGSWEALAPEPDSLAGLEAQESCRRWEAGDWNVL